jgi:FkbM family methyltransferase
MKKMVVSFLVKMTECISEYSVRYVGQDVIIESTNNDHLKRHKGKYEHVQSEAISIMLNQLNVTDVVDVGANAGQFASSIRDEGYEGRIYSFEPSSSAYTKLRKKADKVAGWEAFQVALGSEKKKDKLKVTSGDKFSSLHSSNSYASHIFGKWIDTKNEEEVTVRRLDNVLGHISSNERLFLKIDTQGHDLEVFRGATNIIDKVVCLQSELAMKPLYENMPLWREVIEDYKKHGFYLSDLYPVSKDPDTNELIEADGVFVKK